jgi:hypothetical protein
MRRNHFFTQDFERPTTSAIFWRLHSGCSNHTSLNLLRLTCHSSSIATFLTYPQLTPLLLG